MNKIIIILIIGFILLSTIDAIGGNFTDNEDGTVTDNNTGLIWQQQGVDTTHTWGYAVTYCEWLSYSGYSDWRLPNIKELRSIVDNTKYNPAIDLIFFPNTNASSYWSSTTYSYNSTYAWSARFFSGHVYIPNKSNLYYIRCVRDG